MTVAAQPTPTGAPPPTAKVRPVPQGVAAAPDREPGRLAAWLLGTVGGKGDRTYRLRLLVQAGFALGAARLAGYWHSDLSDAEYSHRIRNLDRPEYGHPGS